MFNLDEKVLSIRGMAWGSRSKRVFGRGKHASTRHLKWRGTVDHVTMMVVLNAAGQAYKQLLILPGVLARFRRRMGGRVETLAGFLPSPNYLMMRDVAGVDREIFYM